MVKLFTKKENKKITQNKIKMKKNKKAYSKGITARIITKGYENTQGGYENFCEGLQKQARTSAEARTLSSIKNQKRGQLKIQQMAFMLMAVTLFFVLVGMFFLVVGFSGLKESAQKLEEKNAILLATKFANSPEFSCGFSFEETKLACVDADKMVVLMQNIERYDNFWGISNVEVRKIFPVEEEKECNFGNYPDCNVFKLREREMVGTGEAKNFVSLCRKESFDGEVYDKCDLAILTVEEKIR